MWVHCGANLEIHSVDRELVAALVQRLQRRMTFDLTVSDRQIYVGLGDETISGVIAPIVLVTD